ncbi:hypothetical protein M8J77_007768 [Diaphorina citri]|nr:hypothetical protein M8J77_007768 [Diaphorina citri]
MCDKKGKENTEGRRGGGGRGGRGGGRRGGGKEEEEEEEDVKKKEEEEEKIEVISGDVPTEEGNKLGVSKMRLLFVGGILLSVLCGSTISSAPSNDPKSTALTTTPLRLV